MSSNSLSCKDSDRTETSKLLTRPRQSQLLWSWPPVSLKTNQVMMTMLVPRTETIKIRDFQESHRPLHSQSSSMQNKALDSKRLVSRNWRNSRRSGGSKVISRQSRDPSRLSVTMLKSKSSARDTWLLWMCWSKLKRAAWLKETSQTFVVVELSKRTLRRPERSETSRKLICRCALTTANTIRIQRAMKGLYATYCTVSIFSSENLDNLIKGAK